MTIYDYNNSRSSMPTMEQHKVGTCKAKTNERWTRIVTTRELCSLQTSDTTMEGCCELAGRRVP